VSSTAKQLLIALVASVAAAIIVDWIRRARVKSNLSVINGGASAAN